MGKQPASNIAVRTNANVFIMTALHWLPTLSATFAISGEEGTFEALFQITTAQ
jgi:hypothetical protein